MLSHGGAGVHLQLFVVRTSYDRLLFGLLVLLQHRHANCQPGRSVLSPLSVLCALLWVLDVTVELLLLAVVDACA